MTTSTHWASEAYTIPTPTTDLTERNLYAAVDNGPAMQEMLKVPGVEPLIKAVVTQYLRPSYKNGSPPEETIEPGLLLHNRILSLDLETVDDANQRRTLGLIQASVRTRITHPTGPPMCDEQSLARSLVPSLIEKAETTETASALVTLVAHSIFNDTFKKDENLRVIGNVMSAADRRLADESQTTNPAGSMVKLDLVNNALLIGHRYLQETNSDNKTPSEELVAANNQLRESQARVLIEGLGMSPEAAGVTQMVFESWDTRIHSIMQFEPELNKLKQTLESESVRQLITEVLPTVQDPNKTIEDKVLTMASDPTILEPQTQLVKIKEVLESDSYKQVRDRLRLPYAQANFDSKVIDSAVPMTAVAHTYNVLDHPIVVKLSGYVSQGMPTNEEIGLLDLVVNQPERLNAIGDALLTSKLNRLFEEPSKASLTFLRSISNGVENTVDASLFLKACGAAIAENYAQASKVTDGLQLEHYNLRVETITNDVRQILRGDPNIVSAYKAYIDGQPELSAKDQIRAIRVYKAASKFAITDINEGMSLEDIEAKVIDVLVNSLTGNEAGLSETNRASLLDAFGEITPLFAYTQKHMMKDDYRTALAELTLSIADGTYDTWRRGDGSEAALQSLKEAGHLPEGLTLEQYQIWISDSMSSSEAELMSSSTEAARTIQEAVAQASVDIALLAPGYTIDKKSLPEVIASRNGLGKLIGLLKKEVGASDGNPFSVEKIQTIMDQVSELSDSQEVAGVMGMLERGHDPKEIIRNIGDVKERMEQMRLMIRLANLSPEEVMAGSFLAEVDSTGNKKAQQKLDTVIEYLGQNLPPELKFIPDAVGGLLTNFNLATQGSQQLTVEDTIDPKVTLEIGETPQRSCQHYETGAFNEGLLGYYDPEVKITIVRNERGGIIARTITRLMQDEGGNPVLYTEPIYKSIVSNKILTLIRGHLATKADQMGVALYGFGEPKTGKQLSIRKLRMPSTYSDSSGGINRGSLTISL